MKNSIEELLGQAFIEAEDLAVEINDCSREIERLAEKSNVLLLRVQLAALQYAEELRAAKIAQPVNA